MLTNWPCGRLLRAMIGDTGVKACVEAVYRSVHPRLWSALLAFTGNAELASDAEAEAFAHVLRCGDADDVEFVGNNGAGEPETERHRREAERPRHYVHAEFRVPKHGHLIPVRRTERRLYR